MAWENQPLGTIESECGLGTSAIPVCTGWTAYLSGNPFAPPVVSDASAPYSPPNVCQFTYPVGFPGGGSPYLIEHGLAWTRKLYAGWFWKCSNPWDGHDSLGQKLHFTWGYGGSDTWTMTVGMYGPTTGPWSYEIYYPNLGVDNSQLTNYIGTQPGSMHLLPNVTDSKVSLGVWHHIELLHIMSTTRTSQDGTLKLWADNVLQISHTNVNYGTALMNMFSFAPTWGGTGDTKAWTDYFWYDHVRLVIPDEGTPPPPSSGTFTSFTVG